MIALSGNHCHTHTDAHDEEEEDDDGAEAIVDAVGAPTIREFAVPAVAAADASTPPWL